MKKVSLTAHKSNIERRERKEIRDALCREAKSLGDSGDIVAFAIVVFDRNGRASCAFDTGKIMPLWAFPGACHLVLESDLGGAIEDFRAPLKKDRPF